MIPEDGLSERVCGEGVIMSLGVDGQTVRGRRGVQNPATLGEAKRKSLGGGQSSQ